MVKNLLYVIGQIHPLRAFLYGQFASENDPIWRKFEM